MDAGSTIAFIALIGLAIAIPISAAEMYKRLLAYKEAKRAALAATSEDREARRVLEGRLAVLEAIVTDRGYDVAHRIEALRDIPAISEQKERA